MFSVLGSSYLGSFEMSLSYVKKTLMCVCVVFSLLPLFVQAEYIQSFDATIELQEDSSFTVTEVIEYVFTEERHGIFRYIPTIHPEPASSGLRELYLDVELTGVSMDGKTVPYEVTDGRSEFYVKIGDPDATINGTHTYTITYEITGGMLYNPATELYWNVTGNDWEVPVRAATGRIVGPDGIFAAERTCYRGVRGMTGSCGSVKQEGKDIVFTSTQLEPGEGMTIAQGLNPAMVEKVVLERYKAFLLSIIVVGVWLLGLIIFVFRYTTAHSTGRTIIPEYEPYPNVKPMYAGLLMDGKLDPRDIAACIVFLAEQGYLKIKKIDKKVLFFFEVDDYELSVVKVPDDGISHFEKSILTIFFDSVSVPAGTTITLSQLKNPSVGRQNYIEIESLRKELEEDLEASGFFQKNPIVKTAGIILGASIVLGMIFFATPLSSYLSYLGLGSLLVAVCTFLTMIVLIVFARRRRTRKGYEARDHLRGFKEFLSVTEKDRYEFHNAPEKSPEQFMAFLPYAIAFGVEEKWAEAFKDMTLPTPGWYDGGNMASFSAVNLSSSLGAFSIAFAASSGASASSGGGSSGGGGGGGGGGSW